ncbi:hypothetical protein H8959_003362 [Pygathrix nigripes]
MEPLLLPGSCGSLEGVALPPLPPPLPSPPPWGLERNTSPRAADGGGGGVPAAHKSGLTFWGGGLGAEALGRRTWGRLTTRSSPPGDTGARPGSQKVEAGLEEKMAAKQPPPLMKKHSQTDLVSRLKTRKILGVGGEDDDGEVHRSKISQVLGNEIKFTVREPLGLRVWQFVSAVLFSGIAIMALAFPDQLYDAVFDGAQVTSKTPIRLYGGALLSISLIMWNALYTAEKVIIRWTLLTEACYFGVQFLVVTATLAETGLMSLGILLLLVSRLLFVAISIYYYYQVGRRPKKA